MPTALTCLEDARAWLAAQPAPLVAPDTADAGAWQRRLIEACAWFASHALAAMVQASARENPCGTPDMAHPEAGVVLRVGLARTRGPGGQVSAWGPSPEVLPDIRSFPVQSIGSVNPSSISLVVPAAKLDLPDAIRDVFGNGVLAGALRQQCDSMLFFRLNPGPGSAFSHAPAGPWQAELAAANLDMGLPPAPAPHLGPGRL